jgi:hypothetical protein
MRLSLSFRIELINYKFMKPHHIITTPPVLASTEALY